MFSHPVFHEGECAAQERIGVREKMSGVGQHAIRDFMPDQHREFFTRLPFVIVGTVDEEGQPWASVLANPPGFIESPTPHELSIHARPLTADPLAETLVSGAPIGLLGIEPHTRRRNRMNGTIEHIAAQEFRVRASQSFGNCPKYINPRKAMYVPGGADATAIYRTGLGDDAIRRLILRADTFFIATAYPADKCDVTVLAHGVDVSHRGGKPGFVRVDDDTTLSIPDYAGNQFFNTIGNLLVNPRAGLLFIDFETRDLLYLAVEAEILWEGEQIKSFVGAQRLLRFRVGAVRYVKSALPLRWEPTEPR
jgi:predicted pyridoxine 5'-phosphate oxidase superfamily flavin-nucleotide-binding protein